MDDERQEQHLLNEDGRFYAISKAGTGLGMLATTERFNNKLVSFGLPSSAALFLSLAHKSRIFLRRIDFESQFNSDPQLGLFPEDHRTLFDGFEYLLSHVVFSFSAIETFANVTIPKEYIFTQNRKDKKCAETYDKEQIERFIQLDTKLSKILPEICDVESPKGGSLWNKYVDLKTLRDRIIHIKTDDISPTGPEIETLWGSLLKNKDKNFCDDAHKIIGYFLKSKQPSRWFDQYPFS